MSELTTVTVCRDIPTDCDAPFREAVIFALCGDGIAAAVAVNEPLLLPAAIITDTGKVSRGLLLPSAITALRELTGFVSVRVQFVLASDVTTAGTQFTLETSICVVRDNVVDCALPASAAVNVALWLEESAPVLIGKVAVAAPAGTGTESGALRLALSLVSATKTALEAGLVRSKVQFAVATGPRTDGAQSRLLTRDCAVSVIE